MENFMQLKIPAISENESFARAAVSAFIRQRENRRKKALEERKLKINENTQSGSGNVQQRKPEEKRPV